MDAVHNRIGDEAVETCRPFGEVAFGLLKATLARMKDEAQRNGDHAAEDQPERDCGDGGEEAHAASTWSGLEPSVRTFTISSGERSMP